MLFSAVRSLAVAALFGLSLVSAQNDNQTAFNCGTVHDPAAIAAAEPLFAKGASVASAAVSGPIVVVWNVIYGANNEGNVPDAVITAQLEALNIAFRGLFSFQVQAAARRIFNPTWFNGAKPGSNVERQMKTQLRAGSAATLNIYSVKLQESSDLLGYATFPWEYQQDPYLDGVVLDYRVMPGGPMVGYNTGKILVHEVGHWLGLLHTFQGGCGGPGDYVDDTPAEASPASGCPVGRDTCPGGGSDPIHNHMDYTNDACRMRFTNGQAQRALTAVRQFRGI
ncbi:hypothetical protein FS749_016124 [Ceratobasidium sp. UAMH 11750]|nr:hypothetical protein FS749_016124 [Ceratobasidium sp. UAMH 11750]